MTREISEQEILYHANRLKCGKIYYDKINNELVEFGYMGRTGSAIVYAPGDSGGGMQSSWAINPTNLEEIVSKTH